MRRGLSRAAIPSLRLSVVICAPAKEILAGKKYKGLEISLVTAACEKCPSKRPVAGLQFAMEGRGGVYAMEDQCRSRRCHRSFAGGRHYWG